MPVVIEWVDRLWPDWVGARVSNRTIYLVRGVRVTESFIAHELHHVLQRDRLQWRFLAAYLAGWARAGFRYAGNWMEIEANEAQRDPEMLAWARDVMREHGIEGRG